MQYRFSFILHRILRWLKLNRHERWIIHRRKQYKNTQRTCYSYTEICSIKFELESWVIISILLIAIDKQIVCCFVTSLHTELFLVVFFSATIRQRTDLWYLNSYEIRLNLYSIVQITTFLYEKFVVPTPKTDHFEKACDFSPKFYILYTKRRHTSVFVCKIKMKKLKYRAWITIILCTAL